MTLKVISSSVQHLAPKLTPYSLHLLVDSMAPKFSIQLKDVNKSNALQSRVLRGLRQGWRVGPEFVTKKIQPVLKQAQRNPSLAEGQELILCLDPMIARKWVVQKVLNYNNFKKGSGPIGLSLYCNLPAVRIGLNPGDSSPKSC